MATHFDELVWSEARWIHVALIDFETDTALIVEMTEDHRENRILYWPAVNYQGDLRSLTPSSNMASARQAAWGHYLTLKQVDEENSPPPIDSVYVRTGSDGFVDELELK